MLVSGLKAQPIITRLDSVNRCPDSLTMQVHIENFTDVASLSLKLNYDTNILVYAGYQNLNPALGGSFLMNDYNNKIILSWFSLSPANIGNGTLVDIRFFYTGISDLPLRWDDTILGNCVYTDLEGIDLPSIFEDGYIHGTMHPPVLISPADHLNGVATNPVLNWGGSGCAPLYSVEIATDSLFSTIVQDYPSVFGTSLSLSGLNLETTYYWRVRAYNALLTTPWSAVHRFKTQTVGGALLVAPPFNFSISPNPASTYTNISFSGFSANNIYIKLYNSLGELCWQHNLSEPAENSQTFCLNTEFLSSGIFFMTIEAWRQEIVYRKTSRLVITNKN